MRAAIDKGIEVHLEEYVAELETRLRRRGMMRGLYKHLKMKAGLDGRKTEGQQAIKDENGNLLREGGHPPAVGEVLRQSAQHQVSHTLTFIVEKVQQRRKEPPPPPPGARSQ